MKKYIQNIWVRLLACFLCILCTFGIIIGVVGTLFFAQYPEQSECLSRGNEHLMRNYGVYALEQWINHQDRDALKNTNLYIKIEKAESLEFTTIPDGEEADLRLENIYEHNTYQYNIKSLLAALGTSAGNLDVPYTDIDVEGYVYESTKGLFYYQTAIGYFRADYIQVCQDRTTYDYRLLHRDGRYVYYNSYYQKELDVSNYMSWDWVELGGNRMSLVPSPEDGILITDDAATIEANLCKQSYYVDEYYLSYKNDKAEQYTVTLALDTALTKQDLFAEYKGVLDTIYGLQGSVSWILMGSLMGLVLAVVLLCVSAPAEQERLMFFHRVPVLMFTAATVALEVALVTIVVPLATLLLESGWKLSLSNIVVPLVCMAAVILLIAYVYLANIITRFKTKTFYRYSEVYYLFRPFHWIVGMAQKNMSIFRKGLGILLGISLAEFLVLCLNLQEGDNIMVFFVLVKLVEIPLVIYVLIQMKALQDGAKRVASGDLSTPIATEKMFWEFKKHGEDINQVSDGIAIAVNEQLKSERFKTELITNVSHDIKTPLTSIINYVDLMKKEDIADPTLLEYMEVLDRQSARLKKLIEDLMEASKASTGNLEVHMEECDVSVLLSQIVGEFEDKLEARMLEPVVVKPEEPVMIMADGRHIWRVLDNLMNNICKYSQENTRVYITLEKKQCDVYITFKNISKTALNIPTEQLMQRFVRGDSSRHTEGSGLGLSIAQSLTELMDGSMKLDIDGDLFKVVLTFALVE